MRIQQLTKKFKGQQSGRSMVEMPDTYEQSNQRVRGQSGRSMVEMLGVLAIIGVLSVGGIAGYRYAMDQYHINQALRLTDLFALSVKEASHSNTLTGYDGSNAHPTCFCYSTQWFCDLYLGKDACGSFQNTSQTTYKVKDYNGIKFQIYNGGGYEKVTLSIFETTSAVCKAVIERVYHTYHDDLPSAGGGSTFNGTFKTEEYREAMANCDEQAEQNGENEVQVSVKFNYVPAEELLDCTTLYGSDICEQ